MKAVLVLVLLLTPVSARAQSLKSATATFAVSAAADWAMTYRFLDARATTEANPILRPFNNRPVPTVLAGAALDVVSVWTWNRYVGRRHPKVAAVGLYISSAYRFELAHRGAQFAFQKGQ